MRKKIIRIYFAVSQNSMPYVKFAIANYINLSSKLYTLEFHLFCLDKFSYRKFKRGAHQTKFVDRATGSVGHAKAVDSALSSFSKNAINIISDTDVAIVQPNWDIVLVEQIENFKLTMIGTQYEPYDGYSSGKTRVQQYKRKPTITWLAFAHGFIPSGLSVMPLKSKNLKINNAKSSEIYGLPIGFELLRDTGWQIPEYIEVNKLKYQVLEIINPNSFESKVLTGLSAYHDEFHLNGRPFLVHQRGSMKHIFNKDPLSRDFYSALLKYFNKAEWAIEASKRSLSGELSIKVNRFFRRSSNFFRKWKFSFISTRKAEEYS